MKAVHYYTSDENFELMKKTIRGLKNPDYVATHSYWKCREKVRMGCNVIHTNCDRFVTSGLLNEGYTIYIHHENGISMIDKK